jgi:NADH-quinone oxidoreductase subunit G
MKGGDPGIRLIEPAEAPSNSYFIMEPQAASFQKDEWLIVPVYQIFGSEELSFAASTLMQRIQEPFVYLNQKDADILDSKDSDFIQLEIANCKLLLKVKIENSLQQGIAGLSINLPGILYIGLPDRGKFIKL